MLRNTNWY